MCKILPTTEKPGRSWPPGVPVALEIYGLWSKVGLSVNITHSVKFLYLCFNGLKSMLLFHVNKVCLCTLLYAMQWPLAVNYQRLRQAVQIERSTTTDSSQLLMNQQLWSSNHFISAILLGTLSEHWRRCRHRIQRLAHTAGGTDGQCRTWLRAAELGSWTDVLTARRPDSSPSLGWTVTGNATRSTVVGP